MKIQSAITPSFIREREVNYSPFAIIWLIICAPFFVSREASFLIQALSYLPAQAAAIAIPGLILYRAGLTTAYEHKKIIQTTFTTEGSANK